jgi:hypothetical protein
MSSTLDELDIALYEDSWDYLNREQIPIAKKVEKLVAENMSPDAIRRHVMNTIGQHREPFAIRCELAARYLYATRQRA